MPLPPQTYKKALKDEDEVLRTEIPLYPDEKKFHIWQASENRRMLHALQNWDWFTRDRPKLLRYLAEVTNRPIAMLRMDSGWKHRLKMENIEALEGMKPNSLRFRSSDLHWQFSLRENWGKIENFKDGYFHDHRESVRNVGLLRIGDPTKYSMPAIVFFKDSSRRDRLRRSRWGDSEWLMQGLEDAVANAQIFYPSFWYLKVEGISKRPRDESSEAEDESLRNFEEESEYREDQELEEVAAETIDFINKQQIIPPPKPAGPEAAFSRKNLLFCIKPGNIDEKSVIMKNRGPVVLFYSWERRPTEPLVLPGRKKQAGERLFSLMGGTGSLLPGQKRRFSFKFHSTQIGTHMERWLCRIYPKPDIEVQPVTLKGVTAFDDEKLRKWRNHLQRVLDYREMMRAIGEALHDIKEVAAQNSRPTLELREREYINTTAAFNFMTKNLKLNPPLYFVPSTFSKLEKFAQYLMPRGVIEYPQPSAVPPPSEREEVTPADKKDEGTAAKAGSEKSKPERKKKSRKESKIALAEAAETEIMATDARARASQSEDKRKRKSKSLTKVPVDVRAESILPDSKEVTHSSHGDNTGENSRESSPLDPAAARDKAREDMFCQPCFDSYVRPVPPPPTPPPPAAWAGSVASILLAIKACPNKKQRRALKLHARELLNVAAIPPHQTTLLLTAMYKALHQVSGDFERVLETVSEESGRPVVEQLLRLYYEQIEAEQVAQEEAERKRDMEGTDELDWPFNEDDTESAILDDEMRKERRKDEAHDLLHYLMKWTHVLTEAKCILNYGFEGFQERVEKDQATVALLIEEKLHELSLLGLDEDACWQAFDLERKKQVLNEEFQELPKCFLPTSEGEAAF